MHNLKCLICYEIFTGVKYSNCVDTLRRKYTNLYKCGTHREVTCVGKEEKKSGGFAGFT